MGKKSAGGRLVNDDTPLEEDEYILEDILDHRVNALTGRSEWLIKWEASKKPDWQTDVGVVCAVSLCLSVCVCQSVCVCVYM